MVFKTYISVRYLNSIMHERIKGKISSIISFENNELLKRNSRIFRIMAPSIAAMVMAGHDIP